MAKNNINGYIAEELLRLLVFKELKYKVYVHLNYMQLYNIFKESCMCIQISIV